MEYALETEGLSKVYKSLRGNVRALKPLDLKVETGTVFGLLGSNGAGKSTLVKTILRICKPTTGRAKILGVDAANPESRRNVGYLPEGTQFARYLTGRKVCEYFGKLAGLNGAKLKAEVDEKLELVGMGDWADKRVTKYSKGMKQRIGLAQAMIGNPRVMILDEPTDGVDPQGRHDIRELILKLAKDGVTLFLNSHMLSEIEAVCDEIAIMYRGEILKRGPVKQITEEMSIRDGMMQLRFRTSELPDELPEAFDRMVRISGGFRIGVPDREQVTQLIDELRQRDVKIYEVEQFHASLEEAFMQIMDEGEHAGIGGVQ